MKRMRTLLCAFLLFLTGTAAVASGPYCVGLPGGDALVTGDGVFVIEPGFYEEIAPMAQGRFYLAGKSGSYTIVNERGSAVSGLEVSMARYTDGVILFRHNGLYGAMDPEGNIIIEPEWIQLVTNGEGGYLALNDTPTDSVADEIIYIDGLGVETPAGSHTVGGLSDVVDGRMPYSTTDGKYGYVDAEGRPVTEAKWLYAGSYSGGAAIVSDVGGMGLADTNGDMIVDGYVFMERNRQLAVGLFPDGTLEVLSADGRRLRFTEDAEGASVALIGGYVAIADGDSVRLYAGDGRCIHTGSPETSFAEGLNRQLIVSDGAWGESNVRLMDPDGSEASGMYQHILPLSGSRYAFIAMNGATYFSQALNGFQRSWDYESIRYGMIDGSGREILPAVYCDILAVEDDRFVLADEEGVYLADESGGIIKSWPDPEKAQASIQADE